MIRHLIHVIWLLVVAHLCGMTSVAAETGMSGKGDMRIIDGGVFRMGDIFEEGNENEHPIHRVELQDYYLSSWEVTVGEFRAFVAATGYVTSAEGPSAPEERARIMDQFRSGSLSQEERGELYRQMLELSGGARWYTDQPRWGIDPSISWRNPGFPQEETHPVVCLSWDDAIHYCNWRSEEEGLPVAYDPVTGMLLDADGKPTSDVARVRGYRLPTEAEWEYAARDGGKRVRFGTGKDVARSTEINYRANVADQEYTVPGEYRRGTVPVGSFPSNNLGLYDMSGNAWEWVSDSFAPYEQTSQVNPYVAGGAERPLRGGRWGGDANELRVFHRSGWARNDRCNNSGFRIARSTP